MRKSWSSEGGGGGGALYRTHGIPGENAVLIRTPKNTGFLLLRSHNSFYLGECQETLSFPLITSYTRDIKFFHLKKSLEFLEGNKYAIASLCVGYFIYFPSHT